LAFGLPLPYFSPQDAQDHPYRLQAEVLITGAPIERHGIMGDEDGQDGSNYDGSTYSHPRMGSIFGMDFLEISEGFFEKDYGLG